mgnify:CR=1 FL=1
MGMVNRKSYGYTNKKQYVVGKGFVDIMKGIGSYMESNKDLIAKPILGAVGALAATGVTAATHAIANRIKRNKKLKTQDDQNGQEVLQKILSSSKGEGIHIKTKKQISNIDAKGQEILQHILSSSKY